MASAKKIKFLENKSRGNSLSLLHRRKDHESSPTLLKLWGSLPPKPYCDRLVSIYFKYFERTMRVLHRPTFMRQYERLWHNNESEIGSSSSIIAQLTSLMTRAYLLDNATNANEYEAHTLYLKETTLSKHGSTNLDENRGPSYQPFKSRYLCYFPVAFESQRRFGVLVALLYAQL